MYMEYTFVNLPQVRVAERVGIDPAAIAAAGAPRQ